MGTFSNTVSCNSTCLKTIFSYIIIDRYISNTIEIKIDYFVEFVDKQVVATFNFIVENVGTEFNCLITSTDLEFAEKLDSVIEQLEISRKWFNSIWKNYAVSCNSTCLKTIFSYIIIHLNFISLCLD